MTLHAPDNQGRLKKKFLDLYAKCRNITASARAIGVDRRTIQRWRRADEAFNEAVLDVEAAVNEELLSKAVELALAGNERMLQFLLAGTYPERFSQRHQVQQAAQTVITIVEESAPLPTHAVVGTPEPPLLAQEGGDRTNE